MSDSASKFERQTDSPTTIDDTRSARQGTPVLSTLPGLPTCMTSQGQRTLKLYTGKSYPQEVAAPSAVASSRGQALAAGTLLLAMDALRSGGSFAILSLEQFHSLTRSLTMQLFTTLINTALARRVETLFLVLFLITAVVVAFFEPGTDFFQDESFVVWLDKPGWNHIRKVMPYEPFPPLYHWLMALWIPLAGDSEAAVRGFSGICFLLSLGVIAWLGRFLFRRDELMAMLIAVVCSTMVQEASVYYRMYTLQFLWSCLALLAFSGFSSGHRLGDDRSSVRGQPGRDDDALFFLYGNPG